MTLKIHRIMKDDLSYVNSIDLNLSGMSNSSGMTISHFAYSSKSTEATLPYSIEVVKEYVPILKEVEFCVVTRKKVDLVAIGVNESVIKENGEDLGKYKYANSVPKNPSDLPPGFIELYRG